MASAPEKQPQIIFFSKLEIYLEQNKFQNATRVLGINHSISWGEGGDGKLVATEYVHNQTN